MAVRPTRGWSSRILRGSCLTTSTPSPSTPGRVQQGNIRFYFLAALVSATFLSSFFLTQQWSDGFVQKLDEFNVTFVNEYVFGYENDGEDHADEFQDTGGKLNRNNSIGDEYEYQETRNEAPTYDFRQANKFDGPIHLIHVMSPSVFPLQKIVEKSPIQPTETLWH